MPSHQPRTTDEVYGVLKSSLKPFRPQVSASPGEGEKQEEDSYVDLFLIHAPWGGETGRAANWAALARAQKEGWVRDIGVSNL